MADDGTPRRAHRDPMKAKRTRAVPDRRPRRKSPPDATGQTIDWIGVQETGGGGQLLPVWLVGGLVAIRSVPFMVRRAAGWLAGRGARR